MKHIFRAYDIRGIYSQDLSIDTMVKIGNAIGVFARNKFGEDKVCDILVGRDVRKSSDTLTTALISGILSSGVNVTDVGTKAFGDTLFAGWKHEKDILVYVTGSHLTADWNGVKFYYNDGQGFAEEDIAEIGRLVLEGENDFVSWKELGNLSTMDYTCAYLKYLKDHFSTIDLKLRIGLDCGGGSACLSAPQLLREMGIHHEPVFCEVDPYFSGRGSEPTDKSLSYLKEAVIKEGLDFGVGFDGDADRGVIVDDKGRTISADIVGIIFGKDILSKQKGIVLANVESSMAVEDVLIPLGADVKRIKVGHTFLTMEAKKYGALLGIERSGHMIIPSLFLFDDALPIPLKLADILSREKRPLSELVDEIPTYPKNTTNFDVDDEKKFEIINYLRENFRKEHERVNTLDGVRVDLENGWGLIRASNTSPVIRVTVEARDGPSLRELTDYFNNEFRKAEERV